MKALILEDRQTFGRILFPHAPGLAAEGVHVLWFEPDVSLWRPMQRWARRAGVRLQAVPVQLGCDDAMLSGRMALRLSRLLKMLQDQSTTVNVILRSAGAELDLLEDCLSAGTLPACRQVFVRWGFHPTLANHQREARLQEACKRLVRLESI